MKGNIDEKGRLWVDRAGVMKMQQCPHVSLAQERAYCSDCCPLFGEPRDESGEDILLNALREACKMSPISFTRIELCHKTLIFDQLTDERVQ